MEDKNPRILLAAPASGSGKTVVTCALLGAFLKEGVRLASFKCGPDYIDPLFHEQVFGIQTRNLDPFFSDAGGLGAILRRGVQAQDASLSVIEGVMGYYDGLGGVSWEASAYDVARKTKTPVILVINAKGASVSLAAQIRGFLEYRPDHGIVGVILNRASKGMFPLLKHFLEEELGIRVFGYLPAMEEAQFESRHLGLLLPGEISDLQERLDLLADACRQTIDLRAIMEAAGRAPALPEESGFSDQFLPLQEDICKEGGSGRTGRIRIGLARDEAFCFYYRENLDLLEKLGAELVPFSPLHDQVLPDQLQGLLLGGGYPELYAGALSANRSMREGIREAIGSGMPTLAECGGFMYLMQEMEGMDGEKHVMCGALPGKAWRTNRLQRFGYISLEAKQPQMGGPLGTTIRAHEFHYFDTDCNGSAYRAEKPVPGQGAESRGKKGRSWDCMVGTETLLAGFPHLYYPSNPQVPIRFLQKAGQYNTLSESICASSVRLIFC